MSKYLKKPVEVEAFRLGLKGEPTPTPEWFGKEDIKLFRDDGIMIYAQGGDHYAEWGDFIVLEEGELWAYSPEEFKELYDYISE